MDCPRCGQPYPEGAPHCPQCRWPLAPDAVPSPRREGITSGQAITLAIFAILAVPVTLALLALVWYLVYGPH